MRELREFTTLSQTRSTACFHGPVPPGPTLQVLDGNMARAGLLSTVRTSLVLFVVAHSCVQRNLQDTLGRATPSHTQPNSAGEKLSFISTGTTITAAERSWNWRYKSQRNKDSAPARDQQPSSEHSCCQGSLWACCSRWGKKFLEPSQPTVSRAALTCLMREVRIAYVLLRLLSSVSTQLPAGSAVCTSSW